MKEVQDLFKQSYATSEKASTSKERNSFLFVCFSRK